MTREKHIKRHLELHGNLDELIADFITHTGNHPSKTTILALLEWSSKQTTNPSERKEE